MPPDWKKDGLEGCLDMKTFRERLRMTGGNRWGHELLFRNNNLELHKPEPHHNYLQYKDMIANENK